MARRTRSTSEDIAEIEREIAGLMRDLENRVGRLNTLSRKGASHAASEASGFVSDTLSETADRLRNGAHAVTDEARRHGGDGPLPEGDRGIAQGPGAFAAAGYAKRPSGADQGHPDDLLVG